MSAVAGDAAPAPAPHAVITGAASGIGEATARHLLDRGWTVEGWDVRAGDVAGVRWKRVDVADAASVAAAAADVTTAALLLNSAGIGGGAPAEQLDPALWSRVIGTNLTGTFHVSRALHPALAAAGGVVVNIASITAHRSGAGRAAYCASKAAVRTLTEVLGLEWAADGIRVVALSPTYVRTPMVRDALAAGRLDEEAILRRTPQRRILAPAEVAEAVHGLLSPAFGAVTGSTVLLDGGWTANGDY